MNTSVAALERVRRPELRRSAQDRARAVRWRVGIVWGLLVFNVLTYGGYTVLPIPYRIGQGITQAALQGALIVALTINRRLVLRPNVFLCLVTLLVLAAITTMMISPLQRGTIYRTFRLSEFVAILWLLTPWWGRRDLLLVRCQLAAMAAVLGSVLLGILISPGHTLHGRLGGVIWPMPATQVAHYAAVTTGLVVVLWLCRKVRGGTALMVSAGCIAILLLTHTRTALVGLIAGLLVAGLSLLATRTRARKLFATATMGAVIATLALSGFIASWLARGENTNELLNLSGRTNVWIQILAAPRDKLQVIFGSGLSVSSFNGLSIDSNWLASYQELGLIGVTICATILVFLLISAGFSTNRTARALALFLIVYCCIASYTEVGFTDASSYLLDLTLAAALLVAYDGTGLRYRYRSQPPPVPSTADYLQS
jgi:hypothetical protein